jgi:hypothetical protein
MDNIDINLNNYENIKEQIYLKQNSTYPIYATLSESSGVLTDYDHFPYTRQFRGDYSSSKPQVIEREAGWRPIYNSCYKTYNDEVADYPKHCFQMPCSTVYPCYTKYLEKQSDKKEMDLILNNVCISRKR